MKMKVERGNNIKTKLVKGIVKMEIKPYWNPNHFSILTYLDPVKHRINKEECRF